MNLTQYAITKVIRLQQNFRKEKTTWTKKNRRVAQAEVVMKQKKKVYVK